METESVFLEYVRYIFKRWAGFQQAKIEGMGGDYADEKEIWLGNEIENYFKRYGSVHPDEIEDYLGAMIENEFNTYFEDGSLGEVSRKFCAAYPLSQTNPDAEIFQEMRNKLHLPIQPTVNSGQGSSQSLQPEQSDQSACHKMEQLTIAENEEDNGWTVVTRKNKNK